jgi:hypothetical protein
MKNQTAIEWLVSKIMYAVDMPAKKQVELVQKALAMEKEQIEEAYSEGCLDEHYRQSKTGEKYFNSTYNKAL